MKRGLCVLGALLMLITVMAGWSFAAEQKKYTFKLSVETAPNHHRNMGLVKFVQAVKDISRKVYLIKYIYPLWKVVFVCMCYRKMWIGIFS